MAGGLGRGGRPWGPIRAASAEAEALARYLRAHVDASGKTLKDLAGEIHVSRTQIGVYLGGQVPKPQFVQSLLRATVPDPRLREHRTAEAMTLLQAAANPSPSGPPSTGGSVVQLAEARAQQVEVYDRLTRSLEQQNQLRETAGNSAKLVMVLLAMINKLERRISDLTEERDQLRTQHDEPEALHRTQQQLTRAREQEERARQELQRAEEKQRQAEELAARVQARADQLTDELDRLRTGATDAYSDAAATGDAARSAHVAVFTDEIGDDIDQALARAAAVNDEDDQTLRSITHDIDQDGVSSRAVPDNPPDNQSTSNETADNLISIRQAATVAADQGDYLEAVQHYKQLFDASRVALGWKHPDTLDALHTLVHFMIKVWDARTAATNKSDQVKAEWLAAPPPMDGHSEPFTPFWFAVPVPRLLLSAEGAPVAELSPGIWYLAVEAYGPSFVAQTADGRRGILEDVSGIQRDDRAPVQPTEEAAEPFTPFWFAVPVPRLLLSAEGTPVAELSPDIWYLAVEAYGPSFVAQTADGRRGILEDVNGIQRG
ncbi:helix-turn-helix domain-containing protein [Streptomyces smyrnaeus]|uniref:helix-turn-helix domain-containing protein n=1 Tax=Streptomyces smyrnaeus TaxID=1387713 RepID=UPI00379E58D1